MKKTDRFFKKTVMMLTAVVVLIKFAGAQALIYQEDCGNPSSNTLVQNYTGWLNSEVVYVGDGTCDVRSSYASSNYEGASAGGNVMINDSVKWFQISGISTDEFRDLRLQFGLRKTASADGSDFVVAVSSDSISWMRLTMVDTLESGTGTSGWRMVHYDGVPSCEHLHIRFSNAGTSDYRVDDIQIVGVESTSDEPDSTAVLDYNSVPICVYPNPTNGMLNVHLGEIDVRVMQLYDLSGRLIEEWTGSFPNRISLSSYNPGTYFLKFVTAGGVVHRKIVRY